MFSNPAKSLTSDDIEDALHRYIILQIPRDSHMVSCRAMGPEVVEKKQEMETKIAKIPGIELVLACVTGTKSNSKKKGVSGKNAIKTGVAFFVVMMAEAIEDEILKAIYESGVPADVKYIRPRCKSRDSKANALRAVCQVVKDHNNQFSTDLLAETDIDACSLLSFCPEFHKMVSDAKPALQSSGLNCSVNCGVISKVDAIIREPDCDFGRALEEVRKAVRNAKHAFYKGSFYVMSAGATYAYEHMCTADAYIETVLDITSHMGKFARHTFQLSRMFSKSDCMLIPQLYFDSDIIETTGGKFFKLSSMQFIPCPYKPDELGKFSPRIYKEYNRNMEDNYFGECVSNSINTRLKRTTFLIKFYQCLLPGQLPMKTEKPLLVGEKNSGKTSMVKIITALTHPQFWCTLSKEKVFGLSQINDDTQFVFIDEMTEELISADMAKIFFQGETLTVARKQATPVVIQNNAGIYITCNRMPDYGVDQEEVELRFEIFNMKRLPSKNASVTKWMEKYAFDVLLWIVKEIKENLRPIHQPEMFFLREPEDFIPRKKRQLVPDKEKEKMRGIRPSSRVEENAFNIPGPSSKRSVQQSLESISDGEGNENAKKQKTLNEAIDEQHHDIEMPRPDQYLCRNGKEPLKCHRQN
ncbi:uncharacterized protein [Clytia hemisphaerica]|uniref:uncharacterized protein n=1 Tax=Clytia hemisphaerica TaxID=252671 RepID=UPI0034D3FC99